MLVWFFFDKREKRKSRFFAKQQLIGMSIFLMSCESNQNTGAKKLFEFNPQVLLWLFFRHFALPKASFSAATTK